MRLIFVTPVYRPSFFKGGKGGGEISNHILFNELTHRKHLVIIISMVSLIGKSIYRDGNVIVIEPFSTLFRNRLGTTISIFLFRSSLKKLFKRIRPQIALASTSTIALTAKTAKENNLLSGAIVRAMENLPGYGWTWTINSLPSTLKYLLHKISIGWPGKRELDLVDFFIANSKFLEKKYLQEFPNKKSLVIYPSLNIPYANTALPEKIKKVMMVGISQNKGFDIFCHLAEKFPALDFHAIGDRSLALGTTRKVNKVTVHGWLADPIPSIDSVDLVLVPSKWEEPFGRISLEAIFRKKFVLVSGLGGLPETVSEIDELIIHSNQLEDWSDRISDLLRNPNKYKDSMYRALEGVYKFDCEYQSYEMESFIESFSKENSK